MEKRPQISLLANFCFIQNSDSERAWICRCSARRTWRPGPWWRTRTRSTTSTSRTTSTGTATHTHILNTTKNMESFKAILGDFSVCYCGKFTQLLSTNGTMDLWNQVKPYQIRLLFWYQTFVKKSCKNVWDNLVEKLLCLLFLLFCIEL